MHWVEEAGDVYGLEVFISGTTQGYFATVQEAEGSPNAPVVVPLKIDGRRIEFELPDPDGTRTFRGEISSTAVVGSFNGSPKKLVLRRGKSYWQ